MDLWFVDAWLMSVEIKGAKIGLEKLEMDKIFALAIWYDYARLLG